jgi:MFS family permease
METKLWTFLTGKLLNLILWVSGCALAGTGLLLEFRLPPGSRGGRGLEVLGMGRHDWGEVHLILGYVVAGLVVAHIAVHWRWLWQYATRKRGPMLLGGLALGALIVAAPFLLPVQSKSGAERGHTQSGEYRDR